MSLNPAYNSLHFLQDDLQTLIGSFVKQVGRNYLTDSGFTPQTICASFQVNNHLAIGFKHLFYEIRGIVKDVQNILQVVAGLQVLNASIEEGFHFRSQEIWKRHETDRNIIKFNRKRFFESRHKPSITRCPTNGLCRHDINE